MTKYKFQAGDRVFIGVSKYGAPDECNNSLGTVQEIISWGDTDGTPYCVLSDNDLSCAWWYAEDELSEVQVIPSNMTAEEALQWLQEEQ